MVRRRIRETFMRTAITEARKGIRKGQTPFGACIVRGGRIIGVAHNAVWRSGDITAHAEIQAIRLACQRIKSVDLSESVIYSTCEPCPMCFSACHWAGISTIVFGARIRDARRAGFRELGISNKRMKSMGNIPMTVVGDFLREETLKLFEEWGQRRDRRAY